MLITTATAVVLRCPACGHLALQGLNLFNFAGSVTQKLNCSCGATLAAVSLKRGLNFSLQFRCIMCDTYHPLLLKRRQLWSTELLPLNCSETGLEVGFIGPRHKVQRAMRRHNRSLAEAAEEMGFNNYLQDPEIMSSALESVYRIAERGKLRCCCGGKNIEVQIFPGHLQLKCNTCGAAATFAAASKKDLHAVQRLGEIVLQHQFGANKVLLRYKRQRRRTKKST